MTRGLTKLATAQVRAWIILLTILCASIPALGASPAETQATRVCHAFSDSMLPMKEAEARLAWNCVGSGMDEGHAVTWVRFEGWDHQRPPRYFTAPITKFAGARIAALDTDGAVHIREFDAADARPLLAKPLFRLDLPEATARTRAYLVAIDRPHSVTLVNDVALQEDAVDAPSLVAMVLVSVVVGMLLMPILFDLLFYLVLRERFMLLHAGMSISGFVWTITLGGVVTAFVQLPVVLLAIVNEVAFAMLAGLTGFFICAFLEPEALPPWFRRMIRALASLTMIVGGLTGLQLDIGQGVAGPFYHWSFIPLLPCYLVAILWALFRGSRAARYVAAAWAPTLITVIERTFREMGLADPSPLSDQAVFFAIGLEVLIVGMGVADRFVSIRRERDQAIVAANTLKLLSERDALTGLFNRRVIEERFALLRQEGFTALAVIDLDHFKRVNDTFGHAMGDIVLRVVGQTLQPADEDLMAFRMGGEEFLLLARGDDAVQLAERRRQDIARAVAHEDLGFLVTASMGIVEVTGGALQAASFSSIYARADRLLYQAKAAGRNRMVCERIKAFQPRRGERRAAA